LIPLSPKAEQHLGALQRHYEKLGRVEALRNLLIAVAEAADKIEQDPSAGLAAPRPYPGMAKRGEIRGHTTDQAPMHSHPWPCRPMMCLASLHAIPRFLGVTAAPDGPSKNAISSLRRRRSGIVVPELMN
jgi:hypothetical protein